jgi:ABC-type dipeptide/oligopeptide/nickel transport system permease component
MMSVLVFVSFQIIPGDVVTAILGTEATPEREEALRAELGLDKPPVERYFRWASGVLRGDLGESYRYSKNMNEMMPVAELIGDKLPVTLWLAFFSLMLTILLAIPIGVLWAGTKNKALDAILNVLTQTSMAIPAFFLGILVTYLFGIVLKVFTPGGYVSYKKDFGAFISYMIFPAIAIAIPKIGMTARFLRNSTLTELRSDYVRTAKSKGVDEKSILFKHVLRNAMLPVVTFLGMIIAEVVAGSIVVEQVFSIPGIGRLLISSISTRDFPVVEILILYITMVVIIVYFIVDVIYRILDPRIRVE